MIDANDGSFIPLFSFPIGARHLFKLSTAIYVCHHSDYDVDGTYEISLREVFFKSGIYLHQSSCTTYSVREFYPRKSRMMDLRALISLDHYPIDHFTVFEPQNPSIDKFYV